MQGSKPMKVNRKQWRKKLKGMLIPAVPVPMFPNGQIHYQALKSYISFMSRQNIGGVAVNVHTGRGLFISKQQRREVLRFWREGIGKDKILVAGVGARQDKTLERNKSITKYFNDVSEMAKEAGESGADAALVYAPVIFRESPDRDEKIVEYHKKIAKENVPVIVFYLYERAGGISYSDSVLKELFKIPQVTGIKMATLDSVMTFQNVTALIKKEFPEITMITGEDRMLGYTIMCGAESALIGMGAAFSDLQADLLHSYLKLKPGRFLKLSNIVDEFAQVTFIEPMEGYIKRMMWALCLLGIIPEESVNDPWGPKITKQEIDNIKKVVNKMRSLECGVMKGKL